MQINELIFCTYYLFPRLFHSPVVLDINFFWKSSDWLRKRSTCHLLEDLSKDNIFDTLNILGDLRTLFDIWALN